MSEVETQANEAPEGIDVADGVEENSDTAQPTPKQNAEASGDQADPEQAADQESDEELDPLAKAQAEIAELKDHWQRERADFTNFRKRVMQEKTRLREEVAGQVVQSLLEAMDNLDRVLVTKTENEELRNFVEGVRMIQGQFSQAFEKHNIKSIFPEGQAFDPNSMEAIATEEKEGLDKDTVLEVFQIGYVHEMEGGNQILRPARVKVGKPAAG